MQFEGWDISDYKEFVGWNNEITVHTKWKSQLLITLKLKGLDISVSSGIVKTDIREIKKF